jgi:phosphoribosyl 1,2-cyclic phosphate phosphodiesterase
VKILVLGSGTSTGVPVPACSCMVCTSSDPKDSRLRTSLLIQSSPGEKTNGAAFNLLIDTSTDLRLQSLRAGIKHIDAVLYTHAHADHIFGMDDLRGFNFAAKAQIPAYAEQSTAEHLTSVFSYVFDPDIDYPGGALPQISLHLIEPRKPFTVGPVEVVAIRVFHGKIPIVGYRIGNFAYLTDCSHIPEESYSCLKNLDVLIVDGLRLSPHLTHFNFEMAIRAINRIGPRKSYLTHLSHEVTHTDGNRIAREMTTNDVELAYDGLTLEVT